MNLSVHPSFHQVPGSKFGWQLAAKDESTERPGDVHEIIRLLPSVHGETNVGADANLYVRLLGT